VLHHRSVSQGGQGGGMASTTRARRRDRDGWGLVVGRAHVGVRSEAAAVRPRRGPGAALSSGAGCLRESWRVSRARAVGSGGQASAWSPSDGRIRWWAAGRLRGRVTLEQSVVYWSRSSTCIRASCRRGGSMRDGDARPPRGGSDDVSTGGWVDAVSSRPNLVRGAELSRTGTRVTASLQGGPRHRHVIRAPGGGARRLPTG